MTTRLQPHEFVSRMDRYQILSADRLDHMQALTAGRLDLVVPLRCLTIEPDLKGHDVTLQVLPVTAQEAGSQTAADELNAVTRERAFRLNRTGLGNLFGQIKLRLEHFDFHANNKRLNELCDYWNALRVHDTLCAQPLVVRALQGEKFRDDETSGVVRAIVSTAYQRFDADDLMTHLVGRVQSGEFLLLKAQVSHYGDSVQIVLAAPRNAFEFNPAAGTHGAQVDARARAIARVSPDGRDNGNNWLPGVSISLSETGGGSVRIEPALIRSVCVNGAIMASWGDRKVHITGERSTIGVAWAIDTVSKKRAASLAVMRDLINHCMSEAITMQFKEAMQRAANTPVNIESLKTMIGARLEKENGVGKQAVEKIINLFAAQYSVMNGQTMFDASQALTEFRDFDADPIINPLLETVSGELLLKAKG